MTRHVATSRRAWPLTKPFRISRGVHHHIDVLWCQISDGEHVGRGEAAGVPYQGETLDLMQQAIEDAAGAIADGASREELLELLPAGGARNAVDCALWDLEAKRSGVSVFSTIGVAGEPVETVYTVGLDDLDAMSTDAAAHAAFATIKVKVSSGDPMEQVLAVRRGAPGAAIIIDANQAWTLDQLTRLAPALAEVGVVLIEQPLPAGSDEPLRGCGCPVPLCADESCDTSADLEGLVGLYDAVNLKLDKTGGLTEALKAAERAAALGFTLMVGNMLGSSLAMAPAFVLAQRSRFVDIDGPLLLAEDVAPAMRFEGARVFAPGRELWG